MNGAQEGESAPRGRQATRARLLDAAAEVFAEVGLGAASVEAICERAGFTRGAFYSNFETKDQLFLELASRFARERAGAVHERVASVDGQIDPTDSDLVARLLGDDGDDRFGALLAAEISVHAMRDEAFAEALRVENERMADEVESIIDDVARSGAIRLRVPVREAAQILLAIWGDASQRAVIARAADSEAKAMRTEAIGRAVRLILA